MATVLKEGEGRRVKWLLCCAEGGGREGRQAVVLKEGSQVKWLLCCKEGRRGAEANYHCAGGKWLF